MFKKILSSLFLLVAASFILEKFVNEYVVQVLVMMGINLILALSLNLICGFTGQFSLGHAGFMALGAYAGAFFVMQMPQTSSLEGFIFFGVSLLISGAVAAFAGLLIGLPALRLKGDYLAIVTLGFGEIIRVLLLNNQSLGGARGLSGIPENGSFLSVWLISFFVFCYLCRTLYSAHGLKLMALRDNEVAAESIGIKPLTLKVGAFVVGAFMAGVAGGLFAQTYTYLNPSTFGFLKSIEIITIVVLGGMGSLSGTLIATVILSILPELLRMANDWRMIVYALLLIILMLVKPNGLMGQKEFIFIKKFFGRGS